MEYSESELTNDLEISERGQFNGETTHEEEEPKRGQYGERLKYDPAGPYQKARVRTDFCWCIGFLLFAIVWLIIIIYGFSKGNADKWLEPMDSEGRICGKDSGVEKRPYLMRYNNGTCDDCLICVHACPKNDFSYLFSYGGSSESEAKKEVEKIDNLMKDLLDNDDKKKTNNGEIEEDKVVIIGKKEVKPDGTKSSSNGKKPGEVEEDDVMIIGKKEVKPDGTKSSPNGKKPGEVEEDDVMIIGKKEIKPDGTKSSPNGKKPGEVEEEVVITGKEVKKADNKDKQSTVIETYTHEEHSEEPPKVVGAEDDDVETRKKHMICKPEVQLDLVKSYAELDHLVKKRKCAETYHGTPKAESTGGRCNNAHGEIKKSRYEVSRTSRDLSNTKYSITGFVFISAVLALISILAMRWFALFFLCGSILVTCAVLFYLIYDKIVSDAENKTTGVLLALLACTVVVVSIALAVLYFRKLIFKSCKMIKESSKAITGLMWTLLFSLLIAFIYGMILMMGVNLYFALSTIDTPIYRVDLEPGNQCTCPPELGYTQNATCDPVTFNSVCISANKTKCAASGCYLVSHEPHPVGFLHFINYVGLYWSFWFFFGFADSVLASVFSNWYWTFNKKILTYLTLIESFWTIGFYHLGTVALGSITILICEIVHCVLTVICKILEKINRPITNLILMQMKFVQDLLETFLNYINGRAYVACAMHGTDFLHSARSSYYLMMRNLNKVYRVAEISNWLTFMLAILISSSVAKISVSYYQSREDEVAFADVPSTFVFLGSLLVTWMMLRVVEVAVETIYQCFLEDSERNDGSCDKPFFASEQISKILYKKQI